MTRFFGKCSWFVWVLGFAAIQGCDRAPEPASEPTPIVRPTAQPTPEPTLPPTPTPTPAPPPPRIVFLARHGEKADSTALDPPLSAAGRARAKLLARMLADAGITAIYTTHFQRTQQTAQPLAERLGLPIQAIQASDVQGMADRIRSTSGGVVLAIAHSDSVVTLIGLLGGGQASAIGPEEFDNLYVLTFDAAGAAQVAHLRYGGSN